MSSREEFEAWYLENWGHTEDEHETLFERDPDSDEEYYRLGVRMCHQAWQAATSAIEAKCAAMAAENAGLKDEISNITFMRDDDFFGSTQRAQEVMGRLVNVKTPATDAFLTEVRAQGVEMFAGEIGDYAKGKSQATAEIIKATGRNALRFAAQLRQGGERELTNLERNVLECAAVIAKDRERGGAE